MSVTIPQTLYETLQTAFLAEGKRLAADAARILGVNEKDLVKNLFTNKLKFTLVEDSERPLSCLVPVQQSAVLRRCRRPCVLGTARCTFHQDVAQIPDMPPDSEGRTLTRLGTHPDIKEPLWLCEDTDEIRNAKGQCVGRRTEEGFQLWKEEAEQGADEE